MFTIVNGDATDLANMLDRLFGLPTTATGQGGAGGGGGPAPLGQIIQTTTAGNEPASCG